MSNEKLYHQYALGVTEGTIAASSYVKLACERYLKWLKRDDIEFNERKAHKAINFIAKLKHFQGKHNGQHFVLLGWQSFVVANIFGWYYKNTNKRVIKNVYIEVGRKNGKTAMLAAICLYCLIADGENGAEVDCLANTRQQAKILFDLAKGFADSIDPKHKLLKPTRAKISFGATKSLMQVLSADAGTLDGFNASVYVVDEYHAAKDSTLYDVFKSSQGMRENPLAIVITSAGFNKFGPCYQMRQTSIEVLRGLKEDDSQLSMIYAIDENDRWDNEDCWSKANPCLDITVSSDYLREQVTQAKNNPLLEVGVRTKNLQEWLDAADIWISQDVLMKNSKDIHLEDFKGMSAYVGIDLAAVSDLTAVSYMIPYEGKAYFKTDYYLPSTCLYDNSNAELYKEWHRRGFLKITDGNVTDYDVVLKDILDFNKDIYITKIAYDAYNATQFVINATAQGLPMEPFAQGIANFNRPTKELQRIILQGKAIIDNNPVTRFCFANVVIKEDWNANIKATKATNQNKIDGVIAMTEALGGFLDEPQYMNEFINLQE